MKVRNDYLVYEMKNHHLTSFWLSLFLYFFISAGPIALKVRAAPVPVVDDQDCTAKINAVTEKVFILPASSFCAGGSLEGNDACQVFTFIFNKIFPLSLSLSLF